MQNTNGKQILWGRIADLGFSLFPWFSFGKVQILTSERKLSIIRTVIVKVEPISSFTQELSDLKQETRKLF